MKEICCYLGDGVGCPASAEWLIVSGPTVDDVTYACTAHVGHLLTDACEQRIYPWTETVQSLASDPENQPNQWGIPTLPEAHS